jgi:hypothetical protein
MKYYVITLSRGFGVRCIVDGYIEARCKTRQQAEQIAARMNGVSS